MIIDWKKRYNRELNNMFRDLDVAYFIRINRLQLIGHVNGVYADRLPKSVFSNQPEGNRLRGNRGIVGGIV